MKAISADDLPEDLFSVLFLCQDHTYPWKALLAYCIALERPLLALLAASYKVGQLMGLHLIQHMNKCLCVFVCEHQDYDDV